MKVNGEAIYGTTASPFEKLAWGRCTQKPGKLYLHVFDWPKDGKLLVPIANRVNKAYLLAQPAVELKSREIGRRPDDHPCPPPRRTPMPAWSSWRSRARRTCLPRSTV